MSMVLQGLKIVFALLSVAGLVRVASVQDNDFCDLEVFTQPNGSLTFECTEGACFFDCGDLTTGTCKMESSTIPAGPGGQPPARTSYGCQCQNSDGFSEAPCLTIVTLTLSVPPTYKVSCHNTCCAFPGCGTPFPAGPYNGDPCPCP